MEILGSQQYAEYEEFVLSHPNGGITQSTRWHQVKDNWDHAVVVSRDEAGRIIGGVSVLIRRVPIWGASMLYSPRGPVCDYADKAVLTDLKQGIDALAKDHKAYLYKMDPDVAADDEAFLALAKAMGFRQFMGGTGFETIQARFNYRLYLDGRDENALLMNLTQQTRRNVRIAMKKGVEVRIVGKEGLGDFMRLMTVTGERDGFAIRSKSYFAKMLDSLGGYARLYMAYYEGKAVAGALTTNYAGKTCYIYGASDNEHRNVMPNYLIQWEMIRWAVETGCTVYDFQGISGNLEDEDDHLYGLYRFKRGFNGRVDELAGEFDFLYKPAMARLVDFLIGVHEGLRGLKRKVLR
jgi:lipid II:glycine glycyltransferase (peptidoglycan interpeptide bridge formation enzyme)